METIQLSTLFHINEQKWNDTYKTLFNSPLTRVLDFYIHPKDSQRHYQAFFYYTEELVKIMTSLMENMNELTRTESQIPSVAIQSFQRACLIEEIKSSNDIEGVHSSRKEINKALDEQDNISFSKTTRLWSIVNKYIKLQNKQNIDFKTSRDLRKFYDEFILDEVIRETPQNIPDGDVFRKDLSEVWSKTKVIHRGVYPEAKIIENMDKALSILHNEGIPNLIRVAAYHYLFGYIHPFYDGNGRTSRFITSYYLSRILSPLVAIRLSITIKKSIRTYYKLFAETNSFANRGDLTPFITGFLWIIQKSIIRVKDDLKGKQHSLQKYRNCLKSIPGTNNQTTYDICFVLLQAALFSKDGATLTEIAQPLAKTEKTINTHIKKLPKEYVLINKTHRAYRFMLNLKMLPLSLAVTTIEYKNKA